MIIVFIVACLVTDPCEGNLEIAVVVIAKYWVGIGGKL